MCIWERCNGFENHFAYHENLIDFKQNKKKKKTEEDSGKIHARMTQR